jgi:ATP-binding cassette subfamily B protein
MTHVNQQNRANPFRAVLTFLWRHWCRHPAMLAAVLGGMMLATVADVLVPIFAGRLVDAVARVGETTRDAALSQALEALAMLAGLGVLVLAGRIAGILGVISLTLRIMSAVGRESFQRVQRFSADWHANSFAGFHGPAHQPRHVGH